MDIQNEINSLSNGATFVRADLHIHSFGSGGSFDVTDKSMTPENIVDTAINKGLKIISITDHNEIQNVQRAIDYAQEKDILVIPGVEISTTQGHLLIYTDTFHNLKQIVGKLHIATDRQTCSEGIVACLDIAQRYCGFGVLAHIELTSGFEKMIGRFGPQMEAIFKHPSLLGLEISSKNSWKFYTHDDDSVQKADRLNLMKIRNASLGLPEGSELPKLMSSDSHTLSKLGINADGNRKVTRVKLDSLSFNSFRVAILSANSRVRIEEYIPESIPHFIGVKFEGGLLDKQQIKFSPNLTCIIGGRGAGKSTFLESVRETSGNTSNTRLVDSEVWADKIQLIFQDETGRQEVLVREINNRNITNLTDTVNGITKIAIESYGQGETAETIQHSDKDPKSLIDFLDDFIELDAFFQKDREICEKLLENESDIEKLNLDVKNIPDVYKLMKIAERKLEVFKQQRVGEIVKLHESLIKERAFRKNLINKLNDLVKAYKTTLADRTIIDNVKALDDTNIVAGKEQFKNVKQLIVEFSDLVGETSDDLKKKLNLKVEAIKKQLEEWKINEIEIQKNIDSKKGELDKQGVPFDMGRITKISKDIVDYSERLEVLRKKERLLKERKKERRTLMKEREEVRGKIFTSRTAFAERMNKNLKETIEDFFVSIKYIEGGYSPLMEDIIKSLMDYRTAQVPKAKIIAQNISPMKLAKAAQRKDYRIISNIKDKDENQLISDDDAKKIISKLNEDNNYYQLENIDFEDRPSVIVTKHIEDDSGNRKQVSKSLAKLSLGQQQSILLSILLHSKSKNPLIIDQPEDNLDSEFIYKTIVGNLRKIKEHRQVIIVTHNPNIAVLGDAELIVPLKSTSDKSMIMKSGSIDNIDTKKITCEILEGGEIAFTTRKKIYGL